MEIVGAWNGSVRTCGEGGRKAVCTFLHTKGDGISASFREQCGGKGRKAMLRRYSMLGWFLRMEMKRTRPGSPMERRGKCGFLKPLDAPWRKTVFAYANFMSGNP